nr:reverse transcriptase domain-containing protein [Tanacetum cinerariifolium]
MPCAFYSQHNFPPLVVQLSPASTSFSNNSSSKMPEVTKDTIQPSTKNIQPPVAKKQNPIYEPVVTPNPKPTIPYPSRVNKQKFHEKDDNLPLKFVEIFRNLHFELSFADALLHMPKFALMFKSFLNNKEKLFDLATTLRPFLRTGRALIDVCGEELTLHVDDEAITFKFGQTLKYSNNDDESINRIDVIDVAYPIIALSSLSLTPFEGGDFILEEIEACLISESNPPGIDDTNLDLEGDIHLLEELLNNDPSLSPLHPKELNVEEVKTVKSSIDEPPKLELKELPSHLEYAYLEGADKLLLIIAKYFKDDEKEALLKVLKSHKRAIAWKIFDIKDGFSGNFQIPIDPQDQEKNTFTCPYATFAYRRMPFGLCNAPGTFQRCMMAIFHDMIEKTMEVFMDDFLVFGDSFSSFLSHLDIMLQRCEDTNLILNWKKCHFMVKEGIVLGHKISKNGLEIPRPMTYLLEKETPFVFSKDCTDAFETLKKKLTEAPILVIPDWNLPFELMCDASDFAIGVSQPVAPITVEQRLARKNELKACGTLLMAFPDKHQLKFNSHKDAKILMEAIEKRFGGNTKTKKIHDRLQKLVSQLEIYRVSLSQEDVNMKFLRSLPSEWKTHKLIWRNKADLEEQNLDDLINSLKIYKTEVKESSSSGTATQNLAFVSSTSTDSTTDSVSAAASVSAACVKLLASPLLNDLKQIDVDNLEEIDLRWQMAMLTMRARRKGHFAWECRSPKDPRRLDTAEPQRRTVPVFTKALFDCENYYSSECDCESWPPSNLYDRFQPSGGYHVVPPLYIGTFMPPKPDLVFNTAPIAVETDHLAFNVQLSPPKPKQDLSHTSRPSSPINEDWVSDSKEESELNDPQQFVPNFAQSSKHVKTQRHSVQPIKTTFQAATSVPAIPKSNSSGKRRNRKACFYVPLTQSKPQKHRVPTTVLTQSKPVCSTAVRPVSAALPNITMTRPRHANHVVLVVSAAQGKQGTWGNPQLAFQDKGVIDSGCSRHMTGNMSYLSDFEELNGGYVAFGELKFNLFSVSQMCDKKNSVLFTDTECLVLSSDFKLPDESQVLLRVPKENNMYNVNLKNIVPYGDLTCLFANATLDESNLWHRRLAHINFKTINKLVKGNLVRGLPTKVFENDHTCIACKKGKQHRASCKTKPVFFLATKDETTPNLKTFLTGLENQLSLKEKNRVLVTKPHNKTLYELLHGRTPSIGFMRPFGYLVTILNTLDPLGKFQGKVDEGFLVGYSVCSKVFRVFNSRTRIIQETLHVNFLENKPNVAEVDFNNLESSILVSPIPTTRIHKDHHVSQIIGDLSSTTQTRSMTRAVKDQSGLLQMFGFEDPDHLDKVYKVVKALYGLHQAPRAWYETLATNLLENGFQRGTIDKTLFIKKPKGDILLVKQKKDGIFISQDKYVAEILRMFGLTEGKSASTPIDTEKPLLKDPDVEDVDVHTYRSMISSLMYLTSSRPDIMFAVLQEANSCCTSSTEAEYLAAASCYAQRWLVQKQMALGKDKTNPLMADNLPKIVWHSTHHIPLMKSWLVQKQTALGQTATGKEISNPFMA